MLTKKQKTEFLEYFSKTIEGGFYECFRNDNHESMRYQHMEEALRVVSRILNIDESELYEASLEGVEQAYRRLGGVPNV